MQIKSIVRATSLFLIPAVLACEGEPERERVQPVLSQASGEALEILVYKSPTCGCCSKWIEHLRSDGFQVVARDVDDLGMIKQELGLTPQLTACHTAVVEGYVVEGHVPAEVIRRLAREKPQIAGIAVPGMPLGSPGMEAERTEPYDIFAFDRDGSVTVFDRRP